MPQHGQDERPVGLCRRDHCRAFRVNRVANLKLFGSLCHLDPVLEHEIHELGGRDRVVLIGRNDERVGWLRQPVVDGPPRHRVHIAENRGPVFCIGFEKGPGGDELIFDDVAQAPPPARPGRGEVRTASVLGESLSSAAQLPRIDEDGTGNSHAGDFGQQPGDVFPPGGVASAAGPVAVEDHVVADAGFLVLLEAEAHVGAKDICLAEDKGVNLVVQGVGLGWNKHPRAGGAHLVLVEE